MNEILKGSDLEKAIADRPFPKVTATSIEDKIDTVSYMMMPDSTVTLCNITLKNGYSVRGESACVDPRNYDRTIGESLAYKDAFGKLWPLEGYLLAQTIYDQHHGQVGTQSQSQEARKDIGSGG